MSDDELKHALGNAQGAAHKEETPDFDAVWAAAERQHDVARRRYAAFSGVAAALAIVAIVAGLWPAQQAGPTDDYLIADSLLNSTQWLAPSDALMPQHRYDIYQEILFPLESTDLNEGSLL